MECRSENPQFDSQQGGEQKVPSGVNLSEFIKHRMEEVVMLTEAIDESPFRGQAFQRLPKHMRRRQMSHYIKRLPRRLQRPYLMSLKDGPPTPTKRPSRKYRRRPGNLLLEYNRRQRNSVWLETHIWHAKRFHMTTQWGYKLPEKPVNKSFRACYRAVSEHCLLVDTSYYNCIELKGPDSELLQGLKQCTSPECGLTFGAKTYVKGTKEGFVTLFHPNSYPYRVIGNVRFMWQPGGDRLWIWVHPLMHDEVVECFKSLFDLSEVKESANITKDESEVKLPLINVPFFRTPKYQRENVTMTLLKDTLNRFRLVGPLSQAVVSQAFTLATPGQESECQKVGDVKCWWEKHYSKDWFGQKGHAMLSKCYRPTDLPAGVILGFVVEDPRLGMPSRREKAVPRVEDGRQIPVTSISPSDSQSPIWIPEIRNEVYRTKLTTHEINEARSKKIVPGFDAKDVIPDQKQSRIPILLVQRPGKQDGRLGLGSGWDIIAPMGFGMPIWLSLIFRGARTGGLKEFEHLQLECDYLNEFPPPDSAAGEADNQRKYQHLKTEYFKLPPSKRPNFTKLGIASPFHPLWRVLVKDWVSFAQPQTGQLEDDSFYVLRNWKGLREVSEAVRFAEKRVEKLLAWGANSLIPVVIECFGRGKPKDMAVICIPNDEDFKEKLGPVEPSHVDENEKPRKIAKCEHLKLLKKLKRRRKKDKEKLKTDFANDLPGKLKWKEILKWDSAPSGPHSKEYNEKMERLWLPEGVESVVNSCSRRVVGFIVKGEFSFSKSRGVGLGFVTLPGLMEVLTVCRRNKSKAVVLLRNRNQVQYRFGELRVQVES